MKTQTILKPCTIPNSFHQQTAMRMVLAGSKFAGLPLALVFLTLLTTVSAWGQVCGGSCPKVCPQPVTNPTACTLPVGGGNLCPSTQYRFSPDHTGAPKSDVLSCCAVMNQCLQLDFSRTSDGLGPSAGPTSSPSVITRTIFAKQEASSPCGTDVWGLWAYGVGGGSFSWDTITQGTCIRAPIRSSPGYPTQNGSPYIFVGGEDGNLYAFGYTDGDLGWTYNSGGDLFNSSPTVSEANEVYIVGSLIYKVHGNTGSLFPNYPIIPNGGFRPANSAASVALSTCGGQPCLIVSGEYPSMGIGAVQAYNSVTTAQLWTGRFFDTPITASPVVSESQGLVYVQGAGSLEAVDLATGVYNWLASFPVTNASGLGSPAYDDSNKYVVVSANALDCGTAGHPSQTFCVGPFGLLAVYDGTRDTGGTLVCMSGGYSGPLFTNSSPTVSNGVIYVGTDDGYVLAYDETSCTKGALNLIWTSPQMTLSGAPDPVSSPPVVSFNRIHVVTQSGTLYVYGLPGY